MLKYLKDNQIEYFDLKNDINIIIKIETKLKKIHIKIKKGEKEIIKDKKTVKKPINTKNIYKDKVLEDTIIIVVNKIMDDEKFYDVKEIIYPIFKSIEHSMSKENKYNNNDIVIYTRGRSIMY